MLKGCKAGGVEDAPSALSRVMAQGAGSGLQLPDGLPSDCTFAFNMAEVENVDWMGSFLSGPGRDASRRLVLPEVARLYVTPVSTSSSNPRVALQKSSCSLMRLHSVGFAHYDWSGYRLENEASGLSAGYFPPLPSIVRDRLPSVGIHPLLPPVLKHFWFICADLPHPTYSRLAVNYECEWAWSV